MLDVNLAHLLVWYLVFVFSTTCHEYAHALVAFKGGDPTAYEGGQLSLDPTPHIRRSPLGMVFVPLLSYVYYHWMIGWASVPFDPRWGKHHPKWQALMSAAGPLANFSLAAVAVVSIRLAVASGLLAVPPTVTFERLVVATGNPDTASVGSALAMALSIMANLNLMLGLFNLLPIPPLDGAGVLEGLGSRLVAPIYEKLREQPMVPLLGLLIAWYLFGYLAGWAFELNIVLALA
jgi:Zn-dependent protease